MKRQQNGRFVTGDHDHLLVSQLRRDRDDAAAVVRLHAPTSGLSPGLRPHEFEVVSFASVTQLLYSPVGFPAVDAMPKATVRE